MENGQIVADDRPARPGFDGGSLTLAIPIRFNRSIPS
jgi:hypothetical protein